MSGAFGLRVLGMPQTVTELLGFGAEIKQERDDRPENACDMVDVCQFGGDRYALSSGLLCANCQYELERFGYGAASH